MRRYLAYVRVSIAVSLQYRASVLARLGTTVVWVMLLTQVWKAVYQGRSSVEGFDLHTTVVYITLANLAAMLLDSTLPYQIAGRVHTGEVLFDISRPMGYIGQMLAFQAGTSIVTAGFIVLAAPLAAFVGGMQAPAGAAAGAGALASLLIGWVLSSLLALIVGLVSFWTIENSAFITLYRLVAQFLAGATVPLIFFPGPLRALANLLPFRFVVYEPAAIWVGRIEGGAIVASLGLAALWVVGLSLLLAGIWRRALRRVVIQGG